MTRRMSLILAGVIVFLAGPAAACGNDTQTNPTPADSHTTGAGEQESAHDSIRTCGKLYTLHTDCHT